VWAGDKERICTGLHTPDVLREREVRILNEEVPTKRKGPGDLVRYSHLGVQFAVILFLSVFGGIQLDKRFSSRGIFTLIGMFAGAAIGIYVLYRETQSIGASPPDPAVGGDADDRGAGRDSDDAARRD
jgi:hypothetical protein